MQYLIKATMLLKINITTYCLYLLVYFTPFVLQSLRYTSDRNNIASFLLLIIVNIISLFFISGIYYQFLIRSENRQNYLSQLYSSSKKYFLRVLIVTVCIAVAGSFLVFLAIFTIKIIPSSWLFGDYSAKSAMVTILRNIIIFLVSAYFIYSIPSIYSNDLKDIQTISISYKFIRSKFRTSLPIVLFLGISYLVNILMTQTAVTFEYQSVEYWSAMFANNIITKTMNLLVFIAAVLILKDNLKDQKSFN